MMKTMCCCLLWMKQWFSTVQSLTWDCTNIRGIILARTDISISVSLIASISRQLLTVWEALFSAKRKFLYTMRTGYWFVTPWSMPIRQQHFGSVPFWHSVAYANTRTKMHRQAVITNRWKTVLKPVCILVIRNFICSWTKRTNFIISRIGIVALNIRKNRNAVTILMKTCMYPVILK